MISAVSRNVYDSVIEFLKSDKRIIAIVLGGSRSRLNYSNDSDYDLFCIIENEAFEVLKQNFSDMIVDFFGNVLVAEFGYLENWGYLFKLYIDECYFDISIIPRNRITEMSIRATNKIIIDIYNIVPERQRLSNDNRYEVENLERNNYQNICNLLMLEQKRYQRSIEKNDYWMAVKCIERLRFYLMRMLRIKYFRFSNVQHCPEKLFQQDIPEFSLHEKYIIDGSWSTLKKTANSLFDIFNIIENYTLPLNEVNKLLE